MATLHFISGKCGAGKTTLARTLARDLPALLICEDEWIAQTAGPITDLQEYLFAAARVRQLLRGHVPDLLGLGVSVVLDFAGNTVRDREWVRGLFEAARADHVLHYLPIDNETSRARVRARNEAQPAGLFFGVVTERQVDEVNQYFEPPSATEGFRTHVHDVAADQTRGT